MDFFSSQEHARTRTKLLVFYFALAVVGVIAAIYLLFAGITLYGARNNLARTATLWNPQVLVLVTLGVLIVVGVGALYKTAQLSSGGFRVAELLGGELIAPNTTDLHLRRLLNVVEEMALASGTPVPPVYLIPEQGINAFAAGYTPKDAVIGVTQGAVQLLNREQLQGVIGHEFSHILNGDMRLNIRLMGILHGILVISMIGWMIVRSTARGRFYARSDKDRGGNPLPLIGLALYIIGYVGVFFGKLIKSAVSRQREFLADASSVQFTRNPLGLSGALKTIGAFAAGSHVNASQAEEVSHMFFADALSAIPFAWMSTHPPLNVRILRIEPGWDGMFPNVSAAALAQAADVGLESVTQIPGLGAMAAFSSQDVDNHVGSPKPPHVDYASAIRERIPDELIHLVREPYGARLVVISLLFNREIPIRARQFAGLQETLSEAEVSSLQKLLPLADKLIAGARLPLAELSIPALSLLTRAQMEVFFAVLKFMASADHETSLFEYALFRMVHRHLQSRGRVAPSANARESKVPGVAASTTLLLSALAHYGHPDPGEANEAFTSGADACFGPGTKIAMLPPEQINLNAIDRAIASLEQISFRKRDRVLQGCVAAVGHDGMMTVTEADLLRAIADGLDCPMPPILAKPERTAPGDEPS